MITVWEVHIAGPPVGAFQTCIACSLILAENPHWADGCGCTVWWPTSGRVAHAGQVMKLLPAEREGLLPEEQWCGGVN